MAKFQLLFLLLSLIACCSPSEFLWPSWGGSITNQQRTPDTTALNINEENVASLQENCKYMTESQTMYGFITVYKNDSGAYNGVFADFSGYVININLDTCEEVWKTNITQVLQEDYQFITRNGLSLFKLSDGTTEGVLFGTPNAGGSVGQMKYAVALKLSDGSLMWKVALGNSALESFGSIHSFMVDGDYAYGGMSSACNHLSVKDFCKFVGRMIKIKMTATSAEIVDIWYTIPLDKQPSLDSPFDRNYYQGAAIWNWPAIIDEYLIFGSGNFYSVPSYIEKCMMEGYDPTVFNNAPVDVCGVDQSENFIQWKCLEEGTFPSAFNILQNVDDNFVHIKSIVLQGTDIFCGTDDDCTLGSYEYGGPWTSQCYPVQMSGGDVDLAAVAGYKYDGELYAAGISKSGMFYAFKIPSGDLFLAKKIGPWSELGGGQFSFAVSEEFMIGVAHITGGIGNYYSILADDEIYCGGVIHAIDLRTGKTLYQIPNPWALKGSECEQVEWGLNQETLDNYKDYSILNSGLCEKGDFEDEEIKVINIDISHLQQNKTENVEGRATFFATVSIANNLLFIPSATGDIFVQNLETGESVEIIRCDYQQIIFNQYGRRGLRAGVTVVEDRIIYYCGDGANVFLPNGVVHSLQLPKK